MAGGLNSVGREGVTGKGVIVRGPDGVMTELGARVVVVDVVTSIMVVVGIVISDPDVDGVTMTTTVVESENVAITGLVTTVVNGPTTMDVVGTVIVSVEVTTPRGPVVKTIVSVVTNDVAVLVLNEVSVVVTNDVDVVGVCIVTVEKLVESGSVLGQIIVTPPPTAESVRITLIVTVSVKEAVVDGRSVTGGSGSGYMNTVAVAVSSAPGLLKRS